MKPEQIKTIKFSVNNWNHLYSLEQAILRDEQATGNNLSILGAIRNQDILNNQDTPISISFRQIDDIPKYDKTDNGHIILGQIIRLDDRLKSSLAVNRSVFDELRKNLMEYVDIDGIHIVVTIDVLMQQKEWPVGSEFSIIKLNYAMKGDA